jgi:hypothetical protein
VDLSDPSLLVALALGVGLFALYVAIRPKSRRPPRCPRCDAETVRGDEIIDPESLDTRHIEGARQAYFNCPECGYRVRARY